jgi:hypothetical protein
MRPQIHENKRILPADRLSHLGWLGAPTRSLIRQKIGNSSELFGYPDFIFNATELDRGYKEFKVSEREFLKNQGDGEKRHFKN